ncbi:hypothetical protein FDP22_06845 [Paroceanicella profunda]|uniref:Helix-turn-helix domain-containing protein n=1 Tax=Paroceanicella profunda TaxID=2579971 RepID=A0A5B8FVV1_9RHOB|nr:hypothetical protein [Paroceanicella profunda]QDL91524.1 hypothetical protein FDP22_06845 [Paroceanicella profunda]
MSRPMILVDAEALAAIQSELAAIRRSLEAVQMSPRPEWIPVPEYAKGVGRSVTTVQRWVREGRIETRREGGVRMVKRR